MTTLKEDQQALEYRQRELREQAERKKHQELLDEIVWAHTNLNTWGAILALCENSLFRGCYRAEQQVARICKAEMQRQLKVYDRATTALLK